MYTAIKGTYENGKVILEESPPTQQKTKVLVMFLADEEKPPIILHKGVRLGSLVGQGYNIPNDFNEPLDDLREYM